MSEQAYQSLERSLLAEISNINRQIRDLKEQRRAIERALQRAKRESVLKNEVVRSNSANRIIVERIILSFLEERPHKAVPANKIFDQCLGYVSDLKDSTFRSYLFRLKERNLIVNEKFGHWRLVDKPAAKDSSP